MKKSAALLAFLLSSWTGPLAVAEGLPSLPDLAAARALWTEVPVPAAPAGVPFAAAALQAAPALPSKFQIVEYVFSLTNKFDVRADGKTLGTITEKFFSLTRSFTYADPQGRCVAQARERVLSWGVHIDVTDCAGAKIGAIKENVFKSLFKVYTTYSILDGSDREVATSEKTDWIGTEMTLRGGKNGTGPRVAKLSRPWLQIFSDHWDVELDDPKAADSRLVVMIAAYKTAVDNARRAESSKDD